MRFDTLGGQCFLAHPTHLLMVMEGARFFQPPESDGVEVDATTTTPSPRNRAKNYGGVGRESKFSQENCMLLKLISIEKRSHFAEK